MKILIFFILVIFFDGDVSSQTLDDNKAHRRYWYYRTRLINDFMKLGMEQGDCIILAERNNNGEFERGSKPGPDQIDIVNHYIMALALEYKLLSRANQDVSETVKELYHLLYMINRLDIEAEGNWYDRAPNQNNDFTISTANYGNLNGYMIREDMPPNYINKNLNHFNYALNLQQGSNNGFCGSAFTDRVEETKFIDYIESRSWGGGNDEKKEMAMPLDKFHSMLTAMMFVNKYLPSDVTFNNQKFQDDETSIKKEAGRIARRVYTYMKGKGNWVLLNPDGSQINVGALGVFYSWPLSHMANFANQDFPWSYLNLGAFYNDPVARLQGKTQYDIWSRSSVPNKMDIAVFMAWDVAGSNLPASFGLKPAYLNMKLNTDTWSVEWAELLRKVLHQDGVLLKPQSFYEKSIAQAPCFGPYKYSVKEAEANYGSWEWSSQDRLEHPDSRGNERGFNGNYPGVDYMLLHNLFYEYQNQLMDGNCGNSGKKVAGIEVGNVSATIYNTVNNAVNTVSGWFGGNSENNNGNTDDVCFPRHPYSAYNLMDNLDQNIWPNKIIIHHRKGSIFQNSGQDEVKYFGTASNPQYIAMYQNLTSSSHIFAKNSLAAPENSELSNVIYRAGKEITLSPGFTVDVGSEFYAYVERFLCHDDKGSLGETHRVMNTKNSDYENDTYNEYPIHFIKK
ncbi:3-coathanger stack domain-containing protein [Chryseobacterium limigenitum]|uniref:Uncharacterized protein n=1 Tax=Chryseobacterium limigenitum TaxID=1612149 RepID=A0A1K2IXT5_9FLAO|nr:3-coathanger stack domain-containing protein [Chryseobacterium limigenitum]SFZ97086.1 hypothetical protein SAMN05216324_13817 [Chryseobacterium limigenitum]